jgi:hypothetical protein
MMFLDCPAYLDQDGAARCGLPAEVSRWFTMGSTDGPLESAVIRCRGTPATGPTAGPPSHPHPKIRELFSGSAAVPVQPSARVNDLG